MGTVALQANAVCATMMALARMGLDSSTAVVSFGAPWHAPVVHGFNTPPVSLPGTSRRRTHVCTHCVRQCPSPPLPWSCLAPILHPALHTHPPAHVWVRAWM
jgi:hypothetical protein